MSGTLGAFTGVVWSSVLKASSSPDDPTLSVVGIDDSVVGLYASKDTRLLFLLGPILQPLVDQIPSMLSMYGRHVDVIIGSQSEMLHHIAPISVQWNAGVSLLVSPTDDPVPLPIRAIPIADARSIQVENHTTLIFHIQRLEEWRTSTTVSREPAWACVLNIRGTTVGLTPFSGNTDFLFPGPPTLLVSPRLTETNRSSIRVFNASTRTQPANSQTLGPICRMFPEDPANFEFGVDHIRLPKWAELPTGYSSD